MKAMAAPSSLKFLPDIFSVQFNREIAPPNRGPHRVKVKNPKARAVKREAEEDWGR